ncbi:MAG: Gfo/Idh/MocA family oxidoreductase, partial [Mucilaginibacter sp.]|uniref:Gfo/Idh/MocA family protein n=1 Tax=Mucilaginibacter sp. TaxID=1882438 RepID=UPI0031B009CE
HHDWRLSWNWGAGEAFSNGTHELDVIRWGLGVDYPTKVVSTGGRFHFNDDGETPDTQNILYNFPNNTAAEWENRSNHGFNIDKSGRGVVFYGDKGTLFYGSNNSYQVYDTDNKLIKEVKDDAIVNAGNSAGSSDNLHLQNFVDAIRGKASLNCPIETGFKSTLLPQLGNIAYRVERSLHLDPSNGHILNDPEAAKLWSREYEKGWEVKV